MTFKLSVYQLIGAIAIFNSLLLAIISFIRRQGNIKANRIIGILFILYGVMIFNSLILTTGLNNILVVLYFLFSILSLLVGPLVWLFTKAFFNKNWKMKGSILFHFLPFILFFLSVVIKIVIHDEVPLWRSDLRKLGSLIILVHILLYLLLSFKEISNHIKLRKFFSGNTDDYIKTYYGIFLIAFIILWLLKTHVFLVLDVWEQYGWCPFIYNLYFTMGFIFINVVLLVKIRNPHFLFRKTVQPIHMNDEKKTKYIDTLNEIINKDELFKDPDMNIKVLSEISKIPYAELSGFINREFKMNFRDYLNKFRIEYVLSQIQENSDRQKNFLQIAFEAGFNSKSAFNAAFKKQIKITPSQYLRSIKKTS